MGGRLTFAGIKLYLDGALGSRGAQLFEDYSDDLGNRGLALMEDDEVIELMRRAEKMAVQIAVHAIGDRANARALDLFERAGVIGGRSVLRIEHAQIVRDADVRRFVERGIFAIVQPAFYKSDREWAVNRLGAVRLKTAYRWRSLIDAGVKFVASSDAPIEVPDPIEGIRLLTGRDGMHDNEALSSVSAFRAYAQTAHELTGDRNTSGELASGFRADLTILDREMSRVVEVIVDGKWILAG